MLTTILGCLRSKAIPWSLGRDDLSRETGCSSYEEFNRLAETRLAQSVLNYSSIA